MSTNMSPRHSTFDAHILGSHSLHKGPLTSPVPGAETLSDFLWSATEHYRTKALNSGFVQGMVKKSLDPEGFGYYMIQDCIFTFKAKTSFDLAAQRADDVSVKQLLIKKAEDFTAYYQGLFAKWHIKDPSGIELGPECTEYVNHEQDVATHKKSIYFIVAIIPCAKLWPWIGEKIKAKVADFGVYTRWVKENFNPDSSAVEYEKLINAAFDLGIITKEEALNVYEKSMKGEAEFFSSIKVD
ncbi:uncharacterized protein LOC127882336 [Dreissena polymorpha]|uniref:uncharacterized protein LOC127882336 n=1 Tax=Dreissena polymorpha TaxID=45954 RepID=UPI002263C58F|nr:uncharacterized protein LOC127882336 [Dreissena polymorpha]